MSKAVGFVIVLFCTWWITSDLWKLVDPRLYVVFCDVGQGDMVLIKKGSTELVVDWGSSTAKARQCLDRHLGFFDRTIELSINSHPQKDHLWGILGALGRYHIGTFGYSGERGGDEFESVWKKLDGSGTKMLKLSTGDRVSFDQMNLKVVWPDSDVGTVSDINLLSVVFLFNYKSFDLFLPGDLEREKELAVVDGGLLTNVEVVKVAHHGSKTSSSPEILAQLKPKLAVISAGKNNSYGHPHDIVLDRFVSFGSSILRTDINGEIVVVTDGNRWRYTVER